MSGARSTTRGLVLSTTTERPAASACSTSTSWRAALSRALGSRSLLTWSWVAANRERKNDVLPEPGNPTRITTSILVIIAERVLGHHPRRGLRPLRGAGARPLRELPRRP